MIVLAQNYILLERIELAASAASVTFSNIPQSGYTDLKIVVSARTNAGNGSDQTLIKFNGSTTGYSAKLLGGTGSAALSVNLAQYAMPNDTTSQTANTFNNGEIYIPNYAGSNNKSYSAEGVQENNGTAAYAWMTAGLWSDASGITIIELYPNSDSYVAGSTFSLYGLAAVGTTPTVGPKAYGGNKIDYDGTYWIHTFTSSGTFTPATALSCDYLVVAGGGAGASEYGGGGGGGGFLTGTGLSVTTATAITVGAGGAGALSAVGTNGSNSIFSSITSTGGGAGGGGLSAIAPGFDGGSGGGGGIPSSGTSAAGSATPAGQGSAGGTGYRLAGGGGGGASAAGQAAGTRGTNLGGTGGNGTANSYSGSSVTYAGGGGGVSWSGGSVATGGTGGGGNGGVEGGTAKTSGTANTGGGGGGDGSVRTGGNGGSGIVVIRYLA